VGSCDS